MSPHEDLLRGVDGPIVVALSGGPDSAAGAWLVAEASRSVRCAHVNHGLPGSDRMREAAVRVAAAVGLQLDVLDVHPPSTSETALREARYEALIGNLDENETLVTAHTSDDQVETVLINLFRGAGPAGLAGIPVSRGPILRPFLEMTSSELRQLAIDLRLPFVDDPENRSEDHLRNRIRNDLLPLIERNYQPAIRTTLDRTRRNMSDAARMLERVVSTVPMERSAEDVRAPIGRLAAADPVVRRQVIRAMLTAARPPLPPSEVEVDRVDRVFEVEGRTDLEGTDAQAFVSGPWLYVATVPQTPGVVPLLDGTVWHDLRFAFSKPQAVRISRWRHITRPGTFQLRPVETDDTIAIREGSKSAVQAIRERGFRPEVHPVVIDASGEIVWIPGVRHAWGQMPRAGGAHSGYLEIVANQDSPWEPFEP